MKNPAELLTLATATARAAGSALARRSDRTVNFESAHDVKMQADVDSEKLIRARLARTKLPVIGEEIGGDASLLGRDELTGRWTRWMGRSITCAACRGRA